MIMVDERRCPKDHACPSIAICPVGAISQDTIYSLPIVDREKCILCGKCQQHCPQEAFQSI